MFFHAFSMLSDFISITNLQRHLKTVFSSKQPMRVVLSKNQVNGIVFSKEAATMLLESGLLDQLREELWELNDKETRDVVLKSKSGTTKRVSFNDFATRYGT